MLRSFTYRQAFRDYRSLPFEPPADPISIQARVYTREGSSTHQKNGFQAFDGSLSWFLEKVESCRTTQEIDSSERLGSDESLRDTYQESTNSLNTSPGDIFFVPYNRERVSTSNPRTGSISQRFNYYAGITRDCHRGSYGNEFHLVVESKEDGTLIDHGSMVWNSNLYNPYNAIYYNPSSDRIIDTDDSASDITSRTHSITRDREVHATTETGSGYYLYEIKYHRVDATRNSLLSEFTDDLLLAIAVEKVVSFGAEAESVFLASSEISSASLPPTISVTATRYRLEVDIPVMDRDVTYFFRWEVEDDNGNILLNSVPVTAPAGASTLTTPDLSFVPLSPEGEWNIVSAYAIPLPTGSSAITQSPERDAMPFRYRQQYRDYQAIEPPPYLEIPVAWSLFAPVKTDLEEVFATGSGWGLSASRKTVYDEAFSYPDRWGLGAPVPFNPWDETFDNQDGWGLKASGFIEETEETFANSDGWTLSSS